MFHQIFFKRETNLLTIASHLNTSQSHCYQLLKQLNVILHPFHINIDSKHFDLTMKGEETPVTFSLASAYDIFNVLENQIVSNQKNFFILYLVMMALIFAISTIKKSITYVSYNACIKNAIPTYLVYISTTQLSRY
ncbi:helix-turn-helix domain-containing protein [Vagococcus lutrae]|uniref:helix-turn-helix domain-containing protein n=1 Tax=Vagococcus lutrae TaxID=81947 RepID=UPI0035D7307C